MKHGFDRRWVLRRLMIVVAGLSSMGAVLFQSRATAQTSRQVELIMFEEPGCPWCRRWHAEVAPGYPLSSEGKRAPLRIVQIHEAASSGVQLVRPVRATPTFVLVSSGREVGRITGYPGAEFFWPMLGDMLAKLSSGPPSIDRHVRIEGRL